VAGLKAKSLIVMAALAGAPVAEPPAVVAAPADDSERPIVEWSIPEWSMDSPSPLPPQPASARTDSAAAAMSLIDVLMSGIIAHVFRIVFVEPRIPPNTGNAIRLAAVTGCELHLVDPLFDLSEPKLRRAGLDYHDLARVSVHADMAAAWTALGPGRAFAFTARGARAHSDVAYSPGDLLIFGAEPTGLPEAVLEHPRITEQIRIPMIPGVRSLNLSNAAAIAVYEAWRQHGYRTPAN
jgi:tRNA (cytidine/uridine-2'-O-)-methyltransferase